MEWKECFPSWMMLRGKSLSNKSFAGFSGFFAGVNYAAPARTYYRDGYYTALAVLPYRPDWVRAQIVTLARGVADHAKGPVLVVPFREDVRLGRRASFGPVQDQSGS